MLSASIPPAYSSKPLLLLVIVALLSLFCYQAYDYVQRIERDRLNMEKSSGRNGKHSNAGARKSAEEQYQKIQEELKVLDSKPGKTAEEVKRVKELIRLKKHWRGKKDWGGEHHSQKHKGN